jgi:hypothetical protein
MGISVNLNMYKQLRDTRRIQRTPGRACVVLPSSWRSEKGTGFLTRPLKTNLPTSIGDCGMGGVVDGSGMT